MISKIRLPLALLLLLLPLAAAQQTASNDYDAQKAKAETYYAEKSFARANAIYKELEPRAASVEEKRWVAFRIAETSWRAESSNRTSDPTNRNAAKAALEALIRQTDGEDDDRVFAEAHESLGDFGRALEYGQNADAHYLEALSWWEESADIALARRRYLELVWKLNAQNPEVLQNAIEIAETAEDRAHARFRLSQHLLGQGSPESIERGLELLDLIIADGKKSSYYDDALFSYASRLANNGTVVVLDDGQVSYKQDYVKALELYRRIVNEFARGESGFREQAVSAIDAIVRRSTSILTGSTFLPGSEQEVVLSWRNVKRIELAIHPIDLTTDVKMLETSFIDSVQLSRVSRRWTYETNDTGEHRPGTARVRITPRVEPGAYVITATGDGSSNGGRQLLLVTDINVTLHTSTTNAHVYVSDAVTGAPVGGAKVVLWSNMTGNKDDWTSRSLIADEKGIAAFDKVMAQRQIAVFAARGQAKQAWDMTYFYRSYSYAGDQKAYWRIYAFTDRPAYRPEETVYWKFIGRIREKGRWTTPAKSTLEYEITDPRGTKVASGKAQLNEFGSAWGELALSPSMPLGGYTINFKEGDRSVGGAVLFQLEEYKLPEFIVDVKLPEEDGKPKVFRLGETVEAVIEARYYFGGPVANAEVEVSIRESRYYRWWPTPYPWLAPPRQPNYGGSPVKTQTLRTDGDGRAIVRLDTPRDRGDLQYTITALVTDASRREVQGSGEVRVLRQRYSVLAKPDHYLHRPGEPVTVRFQANDANDQPVQTTGTVKVIRRVWEEIWIDPVGREVRGRELEKIRVLPPGRRPGWRVKTSQYRDEEVATASVTTDRSGEAVYTFTPQRDGYYQFLWTSVDRAPGRATQARDVVRAETAVWVTDRATADLGYHATGLDLIVDKEAFRAGQTAPVMIVTPASGAWVLLTTAIGDDMTSQLVQLDGTVKLVQIPIDERHVPSFQLTASSVRDLTLMSTAETVAVPPSDHFVTVDVKSDREQYEPREEGTITVTTRDADGKPVAAEVALSVSDAALLAISQDQAGDPRQFFFGETRFVTIQVSASVQKQRYVRMIEDTDGRLFDERELPDERRKREEKDVSGLPPGRDFLQKADMASPPPPMMAPSAVSESITVTAQASVGAVTSAAVAANMADGSGGDDAVVVRHDFRSTAFWRPDLVTGADGTAKVSFKFPESTTSWRAVARAATSGAEFGIGETTSRTSLPLLVRLQAPRFFVVGDRATVSAVINNNSNDPMRVAPTLEVEGLTLDNATKSAIDVPANGDARVDWIVRAEKSGPAKLRVTGRGPSRSDAMERSFTVYEHGIDKLIARSGKLRAEEAIVKLDLPHERRATELTVQIAPSLAVTMLDALPYLIDYPYGCTEQTMSRFLPAAIVARTLAKNGLNPEDIEGRVFGGIEQAHVAATHPEGRKSLGKLQKITSASMARLYDFQLHDGGWGWWKQSENSDPFMTAYVVWGFSIAKEGGLAVRDQAVDEAANYLDAQLVQYEKRPHEAAWMLHALAAWRTVRGQRINALEQTAFDRVWNDREKLTSYSRALLALAAHQFGQGERAKVLIRNLEDGVKIDRAPDRSILVRGSGANAAETMATAHWGESENWWRWHDGAVESTAFALRALVAIEPKHELIEPVMNWLVKNRRGAQWSNTRDTAIALFALNDYLRASGELAGNVSYELSVNGDVLATKTITAADVLRAPSRFNVDPSKIRDANEIRIRRTGAASNAPIYFAVEGRFVSLEEPVTPAGNELFVRRDYFELEPHPTLLAGVKYETVPLLDNGSIASGRRVEVVITIETKNDYDYLVFEDLKPAGFEATDVTSGEGLSALELRSATVTRKFAAGDPRGSDRNVRHDERDDVTGREVWVYQELRDRKVALFIDHLPQGIWEIRYPVRAEVPGSFHALPVIGHAMYVPEIRGNSAEVRVEVREEKR
jgi:uncharacterized protein YfaS (alpha-2-macroglobulin family)